MARVKRGNKRLQKRQEGPQARQRLLGHQATTPTAWPSRRWTRPWATPIATGARRSASSAACGSCASTPPPACNGLSYSRLIAGLKAAGSTLDRKVLADIAVTDAAGFGGSPSWRRRRSEPTARQDRAPAEALMADARGERPGGNRRGRRELGVPRARGRRSPRSPTARPGRPCASQWVGPQAGASSARCSTTSRGPAGRPPRLRRGGQPPQGDGRGAPRRARRRRSPRASGEAARRAAAVDVTLPGRRPLLGSLHPVTLVIREMEEIFAELGYSVAEGPEVEDDYHNFEALNFPHGPSGARHAGHLLHGGRPAAAHPHLAGADPHHAGAQAADPRHLPGPGVPQRQRPAPLADVPPGRGAGGGRGDHRRPSQGDARSPSCAGCSRRTPRSACGRASSPSPSRRPRWTSPARSARASGCEVCSGTGWMEILGCGMVDPRVLAQVRHRSRRYSGFAFGMGVDRVAMIRYGIPNIRLLFENDERLLRQVRG